MAESKPQKQQKTSGDVDSKESKKADKDPRGENEHSPGMSYTPCGHGYTVDKCPSEKDMLVKVKCHSNGALSKKLGAYFNESHFHDVVLKLPGGQEYKAHRLVLSVWSEFFKDKLQGPSRSRTPKSLDLKNFAEGEIEAFEHVLRFMYTGEIRPQDDNVLHICRLAEKFRVRELRRLCEEWICNNVGDHNVIGASARLRDAEILKLGHLTSKCREIFCHYFTRLPDSTWTSLSTDHVEEILKSSELVVEDEYHVLQKLESWVMSNGGLDKQKDVLISRLLPQIRCRFMSATQLKQVREGKMGELFKKLPENVLEDAFEFRAMAGEQSRAIRVREEGQNQEPDSSIPYLKPRLYYNFDFVGASLSRPNGPFKTFRINTYGNSESSTMLVFNNDGQCWSNERSWRYECKAFQDTIGSKDVPWRLKFTLSTSYRTPKSYHIAFLIRESKPSGQQLDAAVSEPELLVMVSRGDLIQEENSDTSKKITLVTPPIFEKSPREVQLCFIGNCFKK